MGQGASSTGGGSSASGTPTPDSSTYAAVAGTQPPKKGKASAHKANKDGSSDSGGQFAVLADDADEPEKGGPAESNEEPTGDNDSDSLSRDVVDNLRQAAAAPHSEAQRIFINTLAQMGKDNIIPDPWFLKLALGNLTNSDADEARFLKVTPSNLASALSAEAALPAVGSASPRVARPSVLPTPAPHTSPSVPQNNSVNPVANTVHQGSVSSKRFTLKNADLPADLKLEGLSSEDVPEKMTLYKAHIRLLSPDDVSEETINHRAIKHLALFVKGAAAKSLSLMLSNALEWRSEAQLAVLRSEGVRITPRSPRTWEEWVNAFTTLFAPANRISLLARDVMTLQAKSDEPVDEYALRVSQAYSRLLAEAERTAPPNTNSYEHAFNQALIASFENGWQPEIRLEMIREDASQSFMASKARARKHEANKLRSAASPSSTSVSSLYHNPQLEDFTVHLDKRLTTLEENADKHVSSVRRGRDGSGSGRGDGSDKRPRPQSRGPRQDSNTSKVSFQPGTKPTAGGGKKKVVAVPCDFVGCAYNNNRFSHTRADCKTEARAMQDGYKVTKG